MGSPADDIDAQPEEYRILRSAIERIRTDPLPRLLPDTPPRVTVAMPARNVAEHIDLAIRSVLLQQGVALELVIVDDGSVDATARLAASFDDPRVRILSNERSRGIGFCHNRVLELARGEFLVHVDADDMVLPGGLQRMLAAMEACPAAAQAFCNGYEIDAGCGITPEDVLRQRATLLHAREARDLNTALVLHGMLATPLRTYRTDLVRGTGGFDESLRFAVDYEMAVRLADAHPLRYVRDFLYCQRVWRGNTQRNLPLRALRSWRVRAAIVLRLLRQRGTVLGHSRRRAYTLLAIGLLHSAYLTPFARLAERLTGLSETASREL